MKVLFYMFALSTIVLATAYGITFGAQGMMRVALIPILISPVMMHVVRFGWELGKPDGLLDPRTQSWAFLFGDTIMLPIALGAAAYSWRSLPADGWYRSTWWLLLSIGVGVVFALVFHFVLNAPNYIKAGNGDMMGSPTSIWHDVVVYMTLSILIVFLGATAVVMDFGGTGWIVVAGLVGWLALGAADATIHPLDQADLHPYREDTLLS